MFRVKRNVTASFPSKENVAFIDAARKLNLEAVCEVVLEHISRDKTAEITKALQEEYEYRHQYD